MKFSCWLLLSVLFAPNLWAKSTLVSALAQNAKYRSVKVSPNGEKLSAVMLSEGRRVLVTFNLDNLKIIGGANLGDSNEVGDHYWVNDERIVMEIWQHRGWKDEPEFYGELAAVNADGKKFVNLFGYRAGETQTGNRKKVRGSTSGWASIIDKLEHDDDHILISATPMSSDGANLARVHKLNVYTGVLSSSLARSPIPYASFITNQQGQLKFVVGIDEDYFQRSYTRSNNEWIEISDQFNSFQPLAFDESGDTLFYFDDENDKTSLYSLSTENGKKQLIYTDPNVDITSVSFTSQKNAIYAVRTDDGYPAYDLLDSSTPEAVAFKDLIETFPGYTLDITSSTKDGSKLIVFVSNDTDAGSYYLFNRKTRQISFLFANFNDVDIKLMSPTEPFTFKSFDDKAIAAYITYPVSAPTGKVPLITLVHGGPRSRDYWLFDQEVQMLASQGYAVLRINYRGSSGYGSEYLHTGDQHWGDDIQQDIIKGTEFVISQGRVDVDKVCIMGASFGGYSALMSSILAPELFKCAVTHAGVYDLQNLFKGSDIPDRLYGKAYLQEALGSDENGMDAFSPVYNIDKLTIPVFIAHGKKDRRVPYKQAKMLKKALDKNDKDYEWFVKKSESHGFFNENNRAEYFEKVSEFLAEHLH